MSQYQTGTIKTEQGTNKVSGESTEWLANVDVGDVFKVSGVNATYVVGLISTDTALSLTSDYVGTSVSGEAYQIVRDFTDNYNIPEIWVGDKDWPYHVTQAFRIIDQYLVEARKTVVDQGEVTTLNMAVTDLNKIHLLQNSGEAVINLPSVDSDDIGSGVEFRRKGIGGVAIVAADSDTIMIGSDTQISMLSGEVATFDFIKLVLETETHWGCNGIYGPWETS